MNRILHHLHNSRLVLARLVAGFFVLAVASTGWGQVIHEDLKLLANDGGSGDAFGWSIAVDNGVVAVGAKWDDDYGSISGSAYLFDASTGEQLFKLLPNDGAAGEEFGWSIAIDKGMVAVGAPSDDDNGHFSGSAYVFDATTGVQIAKLLPSDGAAEDRFGWSISIDNGVVAVGARGDDDNGDYSGAAYLFDASTGAEIAKLLPSDGARGDAFGYSIAIDSGVVAVGARFDDDRGLSSGSAYLFDASTGAEIAKLLASDGAAGDRFGWSIDIDTDEGVVAVGARYADDLGVESGSAYLFDARTGAEIAKLLASDGAAGDWFGHTIAVDEGIVAVGAFGDGDHGALTGSAYLFDASTGAEIAKLRASDGAANDWFGYSIAIDNGVVAAGAPVDEDNKIYSGSAYVFDVGSNGSCLDLIVENLVAGEPAVFTISGGTPGARGVTVYGLAAGRTSVRNTGGYCVDFGIDGVNQSRVIGGLRRTFDAEGEIVFSQFIPKRRVGLEVFFQSAERGTCPDVCMSNLVEAVVE